MKAKVPSKEGVLRVWESEAVGLQLPQKHISPSSFSHRLCEVRVVHMLSAFYTQERKGD